MDKILLAPQGKRSLNELGKIYEKEEDLYKRGLAPWNLVKWVNYWRGINKQFLDEYAML